MGRWLTLGIFALALAWALPAFAGESYKLQVGGLSCPFCAYGIEKKLSSLEGVVAVDVDLASGAVLVTMKDHASLDEATATRAVQAAGFTLKRFEPADDAASGG